MALIYESGYAVIYLRCSTEMQVTEGFSLETQTRTCMEVVNHKKWQVRGIFEDAGKSGASMDKRDGLKNALAALQRGDYLLIYSLSRLSRDVRDALDISDVLEKKEALYQSATEPLSGTASHCRFMITIFTALGEQERKTISERVHKGMETHKERFGTSNNKARYGWKYHQVGKGSSAVVTLLPVRHEQEVIKLIKQLRSTKRKPEKYPNGKERPMPFEDIAEELNKRGIPSRLRHRDAMRTPCKWHGEAVRKIIEKEGNLDPSTNDHEYPDDDEIRDVVPDTYIYLLMKGTGTRVGSATSLHDIYSIPGRTDQTKVHIFSCKSSKDKEQILLQWLSEKGYIIREESPDTLQMCANVPEILEYTKILTRCDNPQLVTIAELREIIQKEAKKQPR